MKNIVFAFVVLLTLMGAANAATQSGLVTYLFVDGNGQISFRIGQGTGYKFCIHTTTNGQKEKEMLSVILAAKANAESISVDVGYNWGGNYCEANAVWIGIDQ